MSQVTVHHGDSRDVLKTLADGSIDSVVCDPPYALISIGKRFGKPGAAEAKSDGASGVYKRASAGFMGQQWDTGETAFDPAFWAEVLRVMKPGAHLLAFSGTRTYHRLACAIEDAGFEIRDMTAWLYGSGFPKSHNISKQIDKRRLGRAEVAAFKEALAGSVRASGKTRKAITAECGFTMRFDISFEADPEGWGCSLPTAEQYDIICRVLGVDGDRAGLRALRAWPRTKLEKLYQVVGYEVRQNAPSGIVGAGRSSRTVRREITAAGTASAGAWEGWGTALKPALEPIVLARKPLAGTVAANVLTHGTGALNIDGCRVHGEDAQGGKYTVKRLKPGATLNKTGGNWRSEEGGPQFIGNMKPGRWPANVVHDGSEEVLAAFPDAPGQQGDLNATGRARPTKTCLGDMSSPLPHTARGDSGSAARFFYAVEPDDHCALCRWPSGRVSAKLSPCDANTAEPSSPTENIPSAATARSGAAGSRRRGRAAKSQPSSTPATNAESLSPLRHPMASDTAAARALTEPPSSLVQNVRSAANLCGSCATAIAQSLAATQRGQDPASLPCPASIGAPTWQILTENLALYVADRANTDTITTTASLKTLLGSVLHAIGATTSSERAGSAASTNPDQRRFHYSSKADAEDRLGSKHPTVKPVDLMQWLCRLVTPPGGVVLDPFAGSGTTGIAAMNEGFDCILIEREERFVADINRRLAWARGEGRLTALELARDIKPDQAAGADLPLFSGDAA